MMEDSDTGYIPNILDENRQGRKETDERLEYHHIVPVREGGKTTIENGAVVKGYNHKDLEKLPKEKRDEINRQLQMHKIAKIIEKKQEEIKRCKMFLMRIKNEKLVGKQLLAFDMTECREIPLEQEKEERER